MTRCTYTVEGPLAKTGGGKLRPWWRRQCLRRATVGPYCWQHDPERWRKMT